MAQSSDDGGTASLDEIVQAVHSFGQLAQLDPISAGEVWMTDSASADWSSMVKRAVEGSLQAQVVFGHAIPLARAARDGLPATAALYSPWTGTLLVFTLSSDAASFESFDFYEADRLSGVWNDPATFALSAMSAIDAAAERFALAARGETLAESLSAGGLEDLVDEAVSALALIYDPEVSQSETQANLDAVIESLSADRLRDPFSLLEDGSLIWRQTLQPVWVAQTERLAYVVFASPIAALEWVWLELPTTASEEPVTSISRIVLYESVTTRRGDES